MCIRDRRKDFETANRKKFCARIATGDYDAVIIGHSQFERIPLSFELSLIHIYVPNNEVLEELFQMFNLSRPQDFEGHSLSVSDVIALKRNGEVSVHYVDSIGFKDLQGFLDKQPERPSVLMNLKEKCDAPECNPTVCRKARDEHEL